MSRYVDLSEKVTATFYDEQYEEWTQKTVTIADVLDSVCDDYTVLPSAQPTQKKGKWVFIREVYLRDGWESDIYECDQCHGRVQIRNYIGKNDNVSKHERFCKHCGADMRE